MSQLHTEFAPLIYSRRGQKYPQAADTESIYPDTQIYSFEDVILSDRKPLGGTTTISGIVTIQGVGVSREVLLLDPTQNMMRVAQTWSDGSDGSYSFENMGSDPYYVMGVDHLGNYSPIIHDTSVQTNLAFTDQSRFNPDDFSGPGHIFGTVEDDQSNFIARRVVLLEYLTYIVVAEQTSSGVDGTFDFTGLSTSVDFTVIAEDVLSYTYNDVIFAKVNAAV